MDCDRPMAVSRPPIGHRPALWVPSTSAPSLGVCRVPIPPARPSVSALSRQVQSAALVHSAARPGGMRTRHTPRLGALVEGTHRAGLWPLSGRRTAMWRSQSTLW